jgi:hypothetical protein
LQRELASCLVFHFDIANCVESYENKVVDYNFGSLIRTDAQGEYGETNTIFGIYILLLHLLCSRKYIVAQ